MTTININRLNIIKIKIQIVIIEIRVKNAQILYKKQVKIIVYLDLF
jgi:hypothetical protein